MKPSEMTDEELNVEIAKLVPCGTCDGSGAVDSGGVEPWGAGIDIPCLECEHRRAQAYTTDLNVMHEAEKSLQDAMNQWFIYASRLTVMNSELGRGGGAHATARQRAEAFYQVMK